MWINDINNATDKASIILFGNKCDLQNRKVSKEEAEKFAKKNNIPYIETSAKLKININEGFSTVANDAYQKFGFTYGLKLKKKKKNKNSYNNNSNINPKLLNKNYQKNLKKFKK
jgi:GTPase SAR1 family protein